MRGRKALASMISLFAWIFSALPVWGQANFYEGKVITVLIGAKTGSLEIAAQIVAEESYEVSEPTADNHIARLQASGADVFVSITTPKFAAQSIRKAAEMAWHPLYIQALVSASIGAVIRPSGFENAQGLISAAYNKDPEFYEFTRSLNAYREAFANSNDLMVLSPDSEFFKYLKQSK